TAPPKATDKRAFRGRTCQAEALAPDVLASILRDAAKSAAISRIVPHELLRAVPADGRGADAAITADRRHRNDAGTACAIKVLAQSPVGALGLFVIVGTNEAVENLGSGPGAWQGAGSRTRQAARVWLRRYPRFRHALSALLEVAAGDCSP